MSEVDVMAEPSAQGSSGSKIKLVGIALGVIALLAAAKYFNAQALFLQALGWIDSLGVWGPVIFGGTLLAWLSTLVQT